MQIYRGSAGLVLKIPFNILVTIGCLPNSIPSFTGSMFDSMLLVVLVTEYTSTFLFCIVFLYLMLKSLRLVFRLQNLNDFCSID